MKASKVVMTFLTTANGLYIRHEADRVEQSYSVEGEAIWENMNPALFGIATPFKSLKEVEAADAEKNAELAALKEEITALTAEKKEHEKALAELAALKEAAGDIDILAAIEAAKNAASTGSSEGSGGKSGKKKSESSSSGSGE